MSFADQSNFQMCPRVQEVLNMQFQTLLSSPTWWINFVQLGVNECCWLSFLFFFALIENNMQICTQAQDNRFVRMEWKLILIEMFAHLPHLCHDFVCKHHLYLQNSSSLAFERMSELFPDEQDQILLFFTICLNIWEGRIQTSYNHRSHNSK